MTYRISDDSGPVYVTRIADGATIPEDPDNTDWVAYQAWRASGNEPEAAQPPTPTPAMVDAERDRRIALGAPVTVGDVSFVVQTRDERDFRNINGLVSKGIVLTMQGDTTTTVAFRDAGDEARLLTGAQLIAMGEAIAARTQAIYAASWTIKAISPLPGDYAADSRWPS